MNENNNTTQNPALSKTAVISSASSEIVDCADCDFRHEKSTRIEKKGRIWTAYHCPKCDSESTCKVN
jgi:hypothetical protein